MIVTTQNYIYSNDVRHNIPNCYGIEEKDNIYYLACYEANRSVIKKYDRNFNFIEIVKTKELDDVHEIRFIGEDLLVTNTSKDSVYSVNSRRFIKLSKNEWDGLHINSIAYYKYIYVLCANGLKVFVLDTDYNVIKTFKIPYNLGIPEGEEPKYTGWYHNIIKRGKWFYSCEKYGLIRFTEDKFEVVINTDSFMRGLAYDGNQWILGQSESKPRDERSEGDSTLLYYDKDFNLINKKILKDSGQIRDIKL